VVSADRARIRVRRRSTGRVGVPEARILDRGEPETM